MQQSPFVKRALTPFGEQRTEARIGDWIDDKAFIGKTHDTAAALTHIGAREYDPTTGTFLSVDPLLETDKPQTLNGYTYGRQNPYTYTDPSGTHLACGGRGGSTASCPKHGQVDSSGRTGSGGMLTTESYPTEDGAVNVGTVRDRFGDIVSVSTHYREYTRPVWVMAARH
jgi:RHS repeat-associated protein